MKAMSDPLHIDSQGAVQLPKPLRERFDWRPGDRLVAVETNRGLLLRRESDVEDEIIGETGLKMLSEILPPEDFSDWEQQLIGNRR